jgi:hypothetical protein
VLHNQAEQPAEFYLPGTGDHVPTPQALSPHLLIDRVEIDSVSPDNVYLAILETRLNLKN